MRFYLYLLLGFLGGIPAGMGMGGGTVTIPLLLLFGGVPQKIAQSANLFAFLPTGACALNVHMKNGLLQKDNAVKNAIPALVAAAGASRRISAKNFRAVSRDSGFVYFFKKQRLTRTDKNDGFNGEIAQEKRRKSIKNKRKNRRNRKIFPKGIDKTRFMW